MITGSHVSQHITENLSPGYFCGVIFFTVGIDLNESTGIRLCQGDDRKWQEQTKREWDKYTFGCYGCWVMDDDGNLDYVSEDDYTEELWNELSRKREGHLARIGHH